MNKAKIQRFCHFFELDLPIIQAGMVWVSGAKLASACANEGIMGTIGAGSMKLDLLQSQIEKAFKLTKPEHHSKLAVNFPLLYGEVDKQIKIALDAGIKNFVTSAGSPKKFTKLLKNEGRRVIHVTSSALLAKKCEDAGVDAIVAEGFEAGGHNGRDETTTMVLIPEVVDAVSIPVIAAGGVSDPRQVLAAHALGADAVQIGSRFAITKESSAHKEFKQRVISAGPGETKLQMKSTVPVRMLKNKFSDEILAMELKGATPEELIQHLGKGRAKAGILDGDLSEGELEIGQVSGIINQTLSCSELISQYKQLYN